MGSSKRPTVAARGALRTFVVLGALASVGTTSSSGLAQSSSRAAAEAVFDEGRRLVASGRFDEACPKFARSHALDPAAGTLLNLADCYEKAGKPASAWLTYSEAVTLAEKSGRAEWAKLARTKVAALRPGLPTLRILFPPSAPAGLEVLRDGERVPGEEAGVAVPVDPGRHTIEARASGKVAFRGTVDAKPGESSELRLPELEDAHAGATAPARRPQPATAPEGTATATRLPDSTGGGSTQRTLGYLAGGLGLAALATGGVFGVLALGSKSNAEGQCSPDLSVCNRAGVDAMGRANDQALLSTIGIVAGAALVAGGAVLLLTAPSAKVGVAVSPFDARLVARW
jgi:hypothetical protein